MDFTENDRVNQPKFGKLDSLCEWLSEWLSESLSECLSEWLFNAVGV
jgi:hypothetical protein